jgi:hypothetical protein
MAPPNFSDKSTTIKPPKLLDQVRDKLRVKHYSIRTEHTYVDWIKRYIFFHGKRITCHHTQILVYKPTGWHPWAGIDKQLVKLLVIGYSHSADGTTSHSTRLPAEKHLAGHPKDGSQVAGYKPANSSAWPID